MNKPIRVGLTLANPLRFIIAVILLVSARHAFNADAQTMTVLYTPDSNLHPGDGVFVNPGLIQGHDGNFYGTTEFGGANTNCSCGTIFQISPSGTYTNLYSFGSSPNDGGGNGGGTQASLMQGSDGNLYGTTSSGGTSNKGTVFRISSGGIYANLYSFVGPPDGSGPTGLIQGNDGNFYGTTGSGGATNFGTVFRISISGTYTTLYSFVGYPDGRIPRGGLVQGSDGNFYGTTTYGGANNDGGTVFRISPSGNLMTLWSFTWHSDAYYPMAGLVQGNDGNFYGTTWFGTGTLGGSVFRISPNGIYTNLCAPLPSSGPSGLVYGSDGNFYGTTRNGKGWLKSAAPCASFILHSGKVKKPIRDQRTLNDQKQE